MIYQDKLIFDTPGRSSINISNEVAAVVVRAQVQHGICQLFLQHTSASLILCENYDPAVRLDLETFMQHIVPDGDRMFTHTMEGPDDMPAHIRSVITHNDITIPIRNGELILGTWQGVFLWEHRTHPHTRQITVTVLGE